MLPVKNMLFSKPLDKKTSELKLFLHKPQTLDPDPQVEAARLKEMKSKLESQMRHLQVVNHMRVSMYVYIYMHVFICIYTHICIRKYDNI